MSFTLPSEAVSVASSSASWPPTDQRDDQIAPASRVFPLRLHMMGQMAGRVGGSDVALPRTRKTRALLSILVLAAPRPVLRSQITALLWSTREREQARASLRQCVHEVQAFLAQLGLAELQTGRQHLQIESDHIWVDVLALGRATSAQPEVLGLLKGGLLEDLHGLDPAFDLWLADQERRLRERAAALAAQLLDQQTEPGAVISAARRLVGIAPTH